MSGNATQRYANTTVLSVCGVDAPHVVTSAELDERLAATYRRVGLRPGLLENLAGITERRWWPRDVGFADAAAMAGAKALAEAGVDPARVGLLVDSSVSRAHLEPSAAVAVHHALGPAADVHELRRGQRLPRVPQRHAARRDDDRRGPDRLRAGRRRRGRAGGPREHPGPAGPPRRDPRRRAQPVRDADARARAPRRWCSAAPTSTRRGTGSSAACCARRPSTTSCASATSTA